LAKLALTATICSLIVLALAITLTVAHGVAGQLDEPNALGIAACVLAVLGEVTLGMLVVAGYGYVLTRIRGQQILERIGGNLRGLESVLVASQDQLKRLTDLGSLSDEAKGLIYHEREIEAMQEVIHSCLLRQDYAHAEQLVDRISEQFDPRGEADRLRAAVAASREASEKDKLNAAVGRVREIIKQRNWERAGREAQRLVDAYPDNATVGRLSQEIAEARNQHKRELLHAYDRAVTRNEVDRSIDLLKALDHYLTPQEADAMRESARGVFRAKLHNLGVQFAIAVADEMWAAAVKTGEEIIRDFPNSRMAVEVNQKLESLRQLASAGA